MIKKNNNNIYTSEKKKKSRRNRKNIYFVKKLQKKINVIKKNYCIKVKELKVGNKNLNCKNLKKQDIEKFIKTIHEFFFKSFIDLNLIGLNELYKRSNEIIKNFGKWEEKIMDIECEIIGYNTVKRSENEGLLTKEEIKKKKLKISEWKFKNYKKWLKIYESKMEKKRKNPGFIKIRKIISELLMLEIHFRDLWVLYWQGIKITSEYYEKDYDKKINYDCLIKKEFIAIDIANSTKIEIYWELKKNWEKKGYDVDLYKKKYETSDELVIFEKEMLKSTWIEIVERQEEYTIYALYLKFICEIISNKKVWVE